ncbi:MAG: GNAT family N-acetyltransferase [Comamonas sp.]
MDHAFSHLTLPETRLPLRSPLPHAGAASVLQLEQRSFNAWPAPRNAVVGDWLLRSAGGYTKRANSANALQPGAALTPQLLEHIEAHYARQQLPSIFRLSPLADGGVDAMLQAHGYRVVDPSLLMQRATRADDQPAANGHLQFDSQLEAAWLESYCAASVHPPEQQLPHRRILESIGMRCAYASLQREGRALAWGLAVLERDAVGLYEVLVHPDHRGQGLGRQMVQGLLQWAARQGATHTDLQVAAANARARQLYESLGFATVYGYHYRVQA